MGTYFSEMFAKNNIFVQKSSLHINLKSVACSGRQISSSWHQVPMTTRCGYGTCTLLRLFWSHASTRLQSRLWHGPRTEGASSHQVGVLLTSALNFGTQSTTFRSRGWTQARRCVAFFGRRVWTKLLAPKDIKIAGWQSGRPPVCRDWQHCMVIEGERCIWQCRQMVSISPLVEQMKPCAYGTSSLLRRLLDHPQSGDFYPTQFASSVI